MEPWITLIAALAGAVVAGGISILVQYLSNRHALNTTRLNLAEERAKWATERQLDRIQKFYGTIEQLLDVLDELQRQKFFKGRGIEPPNAALLEGNVARSLFAALEAAKSETSLLDREIQSQFEKALVAHDNYLFSIDDAEESQALSKLHDDLTGFKKWLSERYRQVFDARRTGADVAIAPP